MPKPTPSFVFEALPSEHAAARETSGREERRIAERRSGRMAALRAPRVPTPPPRNHAYLRDARRLGAATTSPAGDTIAEG
jgi:hypothetical protein